jgi:hypothetical protein
VAIAALYGLRLVTAGSDVITGVPLRLNLIFVVKYPLAVTARPNAETSPMPKIPSAASARTPGVAR